MPGGLARIAADDTVRALSMQSGAASKDVWALAGGPVDTFSLLRPPSARVEIRRTGERSAEPRDGQPVLARALCGAHRELIRVPARRRAAARRRHRARADDGGRACAPLARTARATSPKRRSPKARPATTRACATSGDVIFGKEQRACNDFCHGSRARRGRRETGSRSTPGARSMRSRRATALGAGRRVRRSGRARVSRHADPPRRGALGPRRRRT